MSIFSFTCMFPNSHHNLSSLQYLSLSGYGYSNQDEDDNSHNLTVHPTTLSEALQHLPSLQLNIYQIPNLSLLPDWLGNFTSLYSLSVRVCPKVSSPPRSTQNLANLKDLQIS
ncbi:hypothetical protein FEM48_Zijuj11G0147100 [Ziziphus jujuba var. spinosa]|uniref:Uncharacterized protein n=1 Tax=Ziziphus jujuba var. spinosa TaxID=714518 RepID=A0A978UJJ3_ZIZJJ|nr:hypothetical protein FEM48_Zijuj11G0147100 [Ziziphus jujuba var. spinosa]